MPGGGGGRSRRKPGPSRGRGCWGWEGGRGGEGASSAQPESEADSDTGWASEGRGWEAREPGEGPGIQECVAGGVWRGRLSHAARGRPPSRVPGPQPGLDCSWGCATFWAGVWRPPPSGPSGRRARGLKAGAQMPPDVCAGLIQGRGDKTVLVVVGCPQGSRLL